MDEYPIQCLSLGSSADLACLGSVAIFPDYQRQSQTPPSAATATNKPKEPEAPAPAATRASCPAASTRFPACRKCSGVQLNIDCIGCGNEDELHSGNRCWPCILSTTVDGLLSPDNQPTSPALQAIATALKSMKRANSRLTWIQQPHVTAFLKQLAATPVITHAGLDELPPSPTREYVRGLLVEHAALPRRDELNARFTVWADQALDRITTQTHRDIIRRYIRWHHQRRMNQMDEVICTRPDKPAASPTRQIQFPRHGHHHNVHVRSLGGFP